MDYRNLTIQELIKLCIAGDGGAWKEFDRRFGETIARVIMNSVRRRGVQPTRDLTLDLKQNTYINLIKNDYRALRAFVGEHENSIFGYLRCVASNVVGDHFRVKDNGPSDELPEDPAEGPPSPARMASFLLVQDAVECLRHALATDANCERDVAMFKLRYEKDYRVREIAELHKLPVKTVENILLRLITILRRELKPRKK